MRKAILALLVPLLGGCGGGAAADSMQVPAERTDAAGKRRGDSRGRDGAPGPGRADAARPKPDGAEDAAIECGATACVGHADADLPHGRPDADPPGHGADGGKEAGTDGPEEASAGGSEDAGRDSAEDPPSPVCHALALELLTSDLKNPVYATAPAGDDRIFVLERVTGRVVILDSNATTVRAVPLLDVSAKMSSAGFEAGLLSLAFHPRFATNRTLYVSYTTLTALRVSRFTIPVGTPNAADPASESIVIEIPQLTHHNTGGMLLFGPDGFLYIGTGDDDYEGMGQNLGVLQAKLLRLDVDAPVSGYAIPQGNPFVGVSGAASEIWAYGLREPYRFWFDDPTGDLYIADVGENEREEIDVVPANASRAMNFGWPIMEGSKCHTPPTGCDSTGLQAPAYEYSHAGTGAGTALIGGSVYRGTALSTCWRGRYFFSAYPTGWLRTLQWDDRDRSVADVRDAPGVLEPAMVSFGQDGHGELLMMDYDRTLHRIVSSR